MPARIIEATAAPTRVGPGRVLVTIITPGEGSSGNYSAETLAQAAKDRVFPRGTQMHINHDSPTTSMDHPGGDLRNLVGVLDEDARVGEGGALVAEAIIGSAWRDFVEEFHEFIGASISSAAEIDSERTVTQLLASPFNRVDLVTVAGRGGEITEVLEAARVIESRSILTEVTARDVRSYLQATIVAKHPDAWAYVLDHDEEYVYYEVEPRTAEIARFYRQSYTLDGVNITLTGEPVEVRRQVTYLPVTGSEATENLPSNPAGDNPKEEATVATTQIEESELNELREASSRASALEAENKTLKEESAKHAAEANRARVAKLVEAEFDGITATRTVSALVAESITNEYTDEQVTEAAREAAAEIAAAQGAGQVNDQPNTATESKNVSDDDIVAILEGGR
ncbi:hypothetical protein [Zhihengliuella flava]|uniref:Capsid maturation protease n=1 Tax=Zhihengliuella flava TaxID=1285193 RepID=A0A931GJY2_9MICC|nr:hypothetical protein [Zhihengliuella flava]MBG6085821.1 hypothetical protein [Zhihengliuella flava]